MRSFILKMCIRDSIEVGSAYSYYYGWLAKTIAEFGKIYPKITIGVTEGTSSELMKMAEDSKLDMAIASRREKGMRWIPLKKDRICLLYTSSG